MLDLAADVTLSLGVHPERDAIRSLNSLFVSITPAHYALMHMLSGLPSDLFLRRCRLHVSAEPFEGGHKSQVVGVDRYIHIRFDGRINDLSHVRLCRKGLLTLSRELYHMLCALDTCYIWWRLDPA